ncbi:SCO family protein [Pelagibius sp. Alg239-R121]|uniref:SCO family protein n=1 Tax=Pelagibius sp. Alg239-R121 TaxID=2993448 RepID=UPI0024A68EC4|nr:SCO family protein [Pelagibius sp. Alg239-R121]
MRKFAAVATILAILGTAHPGFATEPGGEAETKAEPPIPAAPLASLFGGPFELVDHDGQIRRDSDFKGKHLLIFFGYTYCPSICPTNLQAVGTALDALGSKAKDVQPLFITVDPERDTPEILREYLAHFHPALLGLTGSEKQIRQAAKAYKVHRRKVVHSKDDPSYYDVDHGTITYLIGKDGKFLTLFPHDTAPKVMAERIEKYL